MTYEDRSSFPLAFFLANALSPVFVVLSAPFKLVYNIANSIKSFGDDLEKKFLTDNNHARSQLPANMVYNYSSDFSEVPYDEEAAMYLFGDEYKHDSNNEYPSEKLLSHKLKFD